MGAVTPLGLDFPSTFANLLAGVSSVTPAPADILASFPAAIVASVAPTFEATLSHADRALDRATQLALGAAKEAVQQARLELDDAQRLRAGVYAGIGMGGALTLNATYTRYYNRLFKVEAGNPLLVHPMTVPATMANAPASMLSIQLGLRGPTATYSVACASSAVALGEAYRAIKHGYADVIVVLGTESQLCLGPYIGWNAMRVMAPADPDDMRLSCKPFSRNRKGFVLGEGAAALVLESAAHARQRGATVLARLAGYGASSDATHITQPSSQGQAYALRAALADAGVDTSEVGYINAHGTATAIGDVSETKAIREVFGVHAGRVSVSATKSMHGHLIGAGGALEFAIAVQAMRTGSIPPTAHLEEPDPECDLDYVPRVARRGPPMSAVVSNSFAFGGTNACLVACAGNS
jgi:3-oxoacyl-[acyl-carrier-protein] synthase II